MDGVLIFKSGHCCDVGSSDDVVVGVVGQADDDCGNGGDDRNAFVGRFGLGGSP